jgi:hypothetical protein
LSQVLQHYSPKAGGGYSPTDEVAKKGELQGEVGGVRYLGALVNGGQYEAFRTTPEGAADMLKVYAVRRSKGDSLPGSEGYEAGLGGEVRYHRIFSTADDGGGFRLFQHSPQGGEYVIWWGSYREGVFDVKHLPPNSLC